MTLPQSGFPPLNVNQGEDRLRMPFPEKEISGDLLFYEQPLNGDRMLEHFDPALVAGYKAFVSSLFSATGIDAAIRELAIIRIGYHSACLYEVHHHNSLARSLGVPDWKIASIGQWEPENLSAPEKAVIAFVDELIRVARPSEAILREIRTHFSDVEVLELVMVIGNWMMGARFVETTGLPVENFAVGEKS